MLIGLYKSQVPSFLVGSNFYNSLDGNDDEQFFVESYVFAPDADVDSDAKLKHLLSTLRFWMSDILPETVIDYVLQTNSSITYDIVRDFATEYTPLAGLGDLEHHKVSNFVEISCSHGNLALLKYLLARPLTFSASHCAATAAAENGHLPCLELFCQFHRETIYMHASSFHPSNLACFLFLLRNGWCPKDIQAAKVAARCGLLDCLQFVLETWTEATENKWNAHPAEVTKAAIIGNHLDCLKYAHEHGCPLRPDGAAKAVKHGHMECLQYFLEQGGERTADACKAACKRGRLSFLAFVHQQGCPLTRQCMETAALYGQLDCLQYVLANGGVALGQRLCIAALQGTWATTDRLKNYSIRKHVYLPSREGCIDCFQYLVANGCPISMDIYSKVAKCLLPSCWDCLVAAGVPMSDQAIRDAIESADLDALTFAHRHGSPIPAAACVKAIQKNSLPILRYLHEQAGLPLSASSCELAATYRADKCLQYAHEQGCKWGVSTSQEAAGCLLCLKYLHEHGCPCDVTVCAAAARGGHLQCLTFLHEQGYPWDATTCTNTTRNYRGFVECLKYAHTHGCPYEDNLCVHAAVNDTIVCLQYAHEHMGCPLSKEVAKAAKRNSDCLIYAVEHGCPVDESIRKAYEHAKRSRTSYGYERQPYEGWDNGDDEFSDLYDDETESLDLNKFVGRIWRNVPSSW